MAVAAYDHKREKYKQRPAGLKYNKKKPEEIDTGEIEDIFNEVRTIRLKRV